MDKKINPLPNQDKNEILLSLIIPAYNEEATIENTLVKTIGFLDTQPYDWEIIVVDDASTDNTIQRVKRLMEVHNNSRIRLLANERNSKKGATIKRGVFAALGRYSAFMDADYAYPATQLNTLLEPLVDGADVVIGNRTDPKTTYIVRPKFFAMIYQRHIVSRIFNLLVRMFLIRGLRDTQCGIKSFSTAAARDIMQKMTVANFAFDVELLYIAQKNGMKIVQVPVTFDYIDEPSSVKLVEDSFIMLKSLFQIKLKGLKGSYKIDARGGYAEDGSKSTP
jgi:dolichyl-phosphate beta-glucosyltransferase